MGNPAITMSVARPNVWIRCDSTGSRRSRASQISGAKHRYERDAGVNLTLVSKSYSETHGFLSRSEFHYEMQVHTDVTVTAREVIDAFRPYVSGDAALRRISANLIAWFRVVSAGSRLEAWRIGADEYVLRTNHGMGGQS